MLGALILAALAVAPAQAPWGRPVAAVELELPRSEQARFARYVQVEPGEPLTREDVSRTVALLHATGAFEDVVVEARSGEQGLVVVVRPQPAPRFAELRVEGVSPLGTRELREVARLAPGEPLWPPRLAQAARDVQARLVERGYQRARVSARAVEFPGGAHAVLTIAAGTRTRVAAVDVDGLPVEAAVLATEVRPRPGEPFERRRVEQSQEKLRAALVRRGYWAAAVAFQPPAESDERVRLALRVEAGPRYQLRIGGAGVPPALERRVAEILEADGLTTDAREAARERLEEHFRADGFRDALVAYREEPQAGSRALVYEVQPGMRSEVGSVEVSGADAAGLGVALATQLGGPVRDEQLDADAAALRAALEARGHATARVEVDVPEQGGRVRVSFRVQPGPRTLVGAFAIDAPVAIPLEEGPRELLLREGQPYRVSDLARDRGTLLSALRNAGYPEARVEPAVVLSEDRARADVTLTVLPGPRVEVGDIVVAGLETTQEQVVRRELALAAGEPLGLARLLESQRRLTALGLFGRVDLGALETGRDTQRDLVVRLSEAPRTTVAYGLGYSDREKVRASVEVTRRNLTGMDRSFSAFARASFKGSRLLLTYREPWLAGHRRELVLTGFREEDDRETFDYTRYGGLAQTAFRFPPKRGIIVRWLFQETNTFNVTVPCSEIDRQYCDSTVSGPSASLVEDTRDDPLEPRRGHFVSVDTQLSLAQLGGDGFVKTYLQAAHFTRATTRVLVAASLRAGVAGVLDADAPARLPLPERFFAGGDYSLRGFDVDTVNPEGGNAMLLGSLELRLDTGLRALSLGVFTDVGNVYPLVSDVSLSDLRYTAGLGIRYRTPVGPLRLDWGYKLDRRAGEPASHLHVTIGHAF